MHTRFVLKKALEQERIRPIVVLNKVDRPTTRPEGEVENEIFDLFAELGATEEQLDYPTLYASGKALSGEHCGSCFKSYKSCFQCLPLCVTFKTI